VFRPADTLVWFAEVHDNATQQPHAIAYTTRVQSASVGRTLFESTDRRVVQPSPGGQQHGFRTQLPLRDFKPGKYILQVEAAATLGGHVAQRELLFEVIE
jgi:hypothetical protein